MGLVDIHQYQLPCLFQLQNTVLPLVSDSSNLPNSDEARTPMCQFALIH